MSELVFAFIAGVIIPLIIIYLLEAIGVVSFAQYWKPATIVVIGAVILIIVTETSKILLKLFKK